MKKTVTIGMALACFASLCMLGGCQMTEPIYPDATERFFVNDFADVLNETDEQTVYETGVALYEATDAQVVLVTVDSLNGQTLEDYALGLARGWGIGDDEKDNGVLLLFTTDGPHTRIEVGYGLEGAINDSKAGRILDTYLVPWYDDDAAWSERLTETYTALLNEVYTEYGLTENRIPLNTPIISGEQDDWVLAVPMLIVLLLLLTSKRRGIFFLPHFGGFHGGFGGGFRGGGGGFGGGGGGFGGGGASR